MLKTLAIDVENTVNDTYILFGRLKAAFFGASGCFSGFSVFVGTGFSPLGGLDFLTSWRSDQVLRVLRHF